MCSSASTMLACTATAEPAKLRPLASVINGCGVGIAVLGRPTLIVATTPLSLSHRATACPEVLSMVITLLPAPVRPPPAAARRSCPWLCTARWQYSVRHGPVRAGQSWPTGYRGRGDNGPGGGVCRVRRSGRGPGGMGIRHDRAPGARATMLPRISLPGTEVAILQRLTDD
jgi:hypothetical protein